MPTTHKLSATATVVMPSYTAAYIEEAIRSVTNQICGVRQRWRIYRDHLHLPPGKGVSSFIGYAVSGVKKYYKKHKE